MLKLIKAILRTCLAFFLMIEAVQDHNLIALSILLLAIVIEDKRITGV